MSTPEDDLITLVTKKMRALGIGQQALAVACGKDQGHLSKVLCRKIGMGKKTEQALRSWLEADTAETIVNGEFDLAALVARFESAAPARRMQIMQLLRLIDSLIH